MTQPRFAHYLLATPTALMCWLLYAAVLRIGTMGWWSYPSWWRVAFPSYFQVAAMALPFGLFFAFREVLPSSFDYALATVVAGITLFPKNPHTDVMFFTQHVLFQLACFIAGCAFGALAPQRLRRFAPLLFTLGLSVLLIPTTLLFSHHFKDLLGTVSFYFFHLGLPAQLASLLLARLVVTRKSSEESVA